MLFRQLGPDTGEHFVARHAALAITLLFSRQSLGQKTPHAPRRAPAAVQRRQRPLRRPLRSLSFRAPGGRPISSTIRA